MSVLINSSSKIYWNKESIEKADIIVFLVAHNEFKNLVISESKVVFD